MTSNGWPGSVWRPLGLTLVIALILRTPAEGRIHALLVGASHYPHLAAHWQIAGPANDVDLLAEVLLTGNFGIQPADVVLLAGWPSESAARPTRGNIKRELERLARVARSGDQVLVFLAGHGSRQPALEESGDLEPDGFDEIFLPADVRHWDGQAGRLPGAIVDDEIRTWLTAIRNRGAFVWCLIDACHAGTMTRGGRARGDRDFNDGERVRQIPPDALGIPERGSQKGGHITPQGKSEWRSLGLADDAGGLVAMYAAQSYETAPERILPWPEGRYQGLFTYTLASVLLQRRGPLTYRELAAEVAARYRAMGRERPTPLIEGGGLDVQVLGLAEWPRRPRMRLGAEIAHRPRHYPLDVGHLAGLSQGTILAVFPPAGTPDPDRRLGYASIVDIDAVRSVVTPVTQDGQGWRRIDPEAKLESWSAGSRAALHALSYDFRLRVTFARDPAASETDFGTVEAALSAAIQRHGAFLARVERVEDADWVVRLLEQAVILQPASGEGSDISAGEESQPRFQVGQPSRLTELSKELAETLRRIARAHHLLALETTALATEAGPEDPLDVQLALRGFQGPADRTGQPVTWGREGLILRAGQEVAFEIVNASRQSVDVTLLFIDSGYGIRPLFPRHGESNRLGPGERAFPIYRTRLNATTVGKESVVAIAVKADGPQRSFVELAQPTVEAYRAEQRRGKARHSPLERFFESVLYGQGGRRGFSASAAADYVVQVLPWETRK